MSGSKSYLIAAYLEEKGFKNINLIGYDLLDKNIRYLKSGTIRFLIGQTAGRTDIQGGKEAFRVPFIE